jgi:hypothetical protein
MPIRRDEDVRAFSHRPRWHVRQIKRELASFKDSLAWISPWGLGVDLCEQAITATALQHMPYTVPRIACLNLSDTNIDDRGLRLLRAARRLETLQRSGTRITTAGLAALITLPNLVEIEAADAGLTSDYVLVLQQQGLRAKVSLQRRFPQCRVSGP